MTEKPRWYQGVVPVFLALLLMGPFAFPLLWKSSRFNFFWKAALTLLFVVSTLLMIKASAAIVEVLLQQIQEMKEAGLL